MTHHVAHTNRMMFDLKKQYQNSIDQLRQKIDQQKNEIAMLENMISLLEQSKNREYDC